MAKLLIYVIETLDNISRKIIKGKDRYYLPKITSDQLNYDRNHQGFSGEVVPDCRLNIAIKKF